MIRVGDLWKLEFVHLCSDTVVLIPVPKRIICSMFDNYARTELIGTGFYFVSSFSFRNHVNTFAVKGARVNRPSRVLKTYYSEHCFSID